LPALPSGYAAAKTHSLETDGDPLLMDFTTIGSVPGNLAGGVGKTQTTCSVGATPSPADDARILTDVTATLIRNPNGSITVTPTLHLRVIDTVDLCPGNCGSDVGVINEQLATIPMSRLEASGVSGDVPFTVDFTVAQPSFAVPPPAPPVPQHVVVAASTLFDYGSADLRSGGEDALVAELGDRPTQADLTQPFSIEGHTDSKGSEPFNQGLSERRAATVAEVLARRYPNLAGHLHPSGFGETRPIAPNEIGGHDNPDGRAQNRRVELRFSAPPAP
jgi:outer membrane protein OmpA-like peptidoglycan-associated protein